MIRDLYRSMGVPAHITEIMYSDDTVLQHFAKKYQKQFDNANSQHEFSRIAQNLKTFINAHMGFTDADWRL
jgi:hypothetical protein